MSVLPDPREPPTAAELRAPRSKTDLFIAFTRLALQGFGGVLGVAQHELVDRLRWLNKEQFVELLSLSQVLPGPNVINLSLMFGDRHFGWRGALAAVAGMLAAPLVIVLALALLYAQFSAVPQVAGALRGMGAVAAGLITATGLKLMPALKKNVLGVPVSAVLGVAAFVAIAWFKLPLLWVLLTLGGVGCVLAFRKLA